MTAEHPNPPPAFQVNQTGGGFLNLGGWYWCRLGPDGFPSEPINSHGPYFLRSRAWADGARETGGEGTNG